MRNVVLGCNTNVVVFIIISIIIIVVVIKYKLFYL